VKADSLTGLIAVARGNSPAALLLKNARVVNVFNATVEKANVAIYDGRIAGVGDYTDAQQIIDVGGQFVIPGLINGHTHIESSLLDIGQYAAAVVPLGTLGVVTDLHEIANVSGLDGLRYMLNKVRELPFEFFLMAPSCVPATPFETSGAVIDATELKRIRNRRAAIGLGEMMNYPGVLAGDKQVLGKIRDAALIDGHAPTLTGKDLNAYIAAGITSDHESVTLAEAAEKLARGMYVMIREGSSEKNLEALLPLVNAENNRRCLLVVDDRSCADLLADGDINAVLRKAVRLGLDPLRAVQMGTLNAAERFGLKRVGAVAPGYLANLAVTPDLVEFRMSMVFHRGRLVAQNGKPLFAPQVTAGGRLTHSVNIRKHTASVFRVKGSGQKMPVIEIVPGQIITRRAAADIQPDSRGFLHADIAKDLLKLAVVERHHATGNTGLGFVKGFGLKRGALASSVAHDSHNIVVLGTNDADMALAVGEIIRLQGGMVAVENGEIRASLPLPVAGLLSDKPLGEVSTELEKLETTAHAMGSVIPASFALLSFLALPVIPELRLTDRGLFDVTRFKFIDL